jgi:hypothetical protein
MLQQAGEAFFALDTRLPISRVRLAIHHIPVGDRLEDNIHSMSQSIESSIESGHSQFDIYPQLVEESVGRPHRGICHQNNVYKSPIIVVLGADRGQVFRGGDEGVPLRGENHLVY